ncbi:hypothetical protein PAXINDRAFT_8393 [Paxillus involutus ATCC 200175]|nr:hypothetical protein PAXINDRAFT_8393 [Paxillus involutus ATCC 200175]
MSEAMSDSNVIGATTMLRTKLYSLNSDLELSLPNARYEKNKKNLEISVDNKVEWSYEWTDTFAPLSDLDLHIPLSSIITFSLSGRRHFRDHLLASHSGLIVDFLINKDGPLALRDTIIGSHAPCATIRMGLSAIVDYQQAQIDSVDASLAQLDNTQSLAGRLDDGDQLEAISAVLARNSAITTCGQYTVPLGQALRLMKKLINNAAESRVDIIIFGVYGQSRPDSGDEGLTGSAWQVIQQQELDDWCVQGLAEDLRKVVGVASECLLVDLKSPISFIRCIERLALQVPLLIDEYIKSSFTTHVYNKAQVDYVKKRITQCQATFNELYGDLTMIIVLYHQLMSRDQLHR